jgi:pSer/pThr/pTyr-binding forkhead associated (FHA) protein
MGKLIIKFNDVVIDQIMLQQGDMHIGRQPGSDIFLDNLAVSGTHASIFTVGDDSFIQDQNSTNGTLINNKRVNKHHLRNGDMITIGSHTLIYVNESAVNNVPDLAKTVIVRPEQASAMLAAAAQGGGTAVAEPPAAKARTRSGAIFILSGASSGKRIDLMKAVTNLGKAGKKGGVINRNPDGSYILLSGGAEVEPKLNGAAVDASGKELRNGDIIEISGSRMQFYLK